MEHKQVMTNPMSTLLKRWENLKDIVKELDEKEIIKDLQEIIEKLSQEPVIENLKEIMNRLSQARVIENLQGINLQGIIEKLSQEPVIENLQEIIEKLKSMNSRPQPKPLTDQERMVLERIDSLEAIMSKLKIFIDEPIINILWRWINLGTKDTLPSIERIIYVMKIMNMLTKEEDVNQINALSGQAAIHYAIQNNWPEVLELLLNVAGADVNLPNKTKQSPLHLLFSSFYNQNVDQVKILDLLLQYKADTNMKNEEGETPLQCLMKFESGSTEVVEKLIKADTNPEIKNADGKTSVECLQIKPSF